MVIRDIEEISESRGVRAMDPLLRKQESFRSPPHFSDRRAAVISRVKPKTPANSARSSRMDGPSRPRELLRADLALPSGVRGPVDRSHGRFASVAARTLSRPSAVNPRHF